MTRLEVAPWVAAVLAVAPLAAQAPVPVHREPHHRLAFEQGPVRVLDVQIAPGDTSQYHIHDTPILYVPVSVSQTEAQVLGREWPAAGPRGWSRMSGVAAVMDSGYATDPVTHRVTNVGTGLFRLIAVTNSRGTGPSPVGRAGDPLPGVAVLTSSWFTATQLVVMPGVRSGWRTAQAPIVIVEPGPGHSRVERDSGGESTVLDRPGSWAYVAAGTRYRLAGSATLVLVQVHE